MLHNFHDGSVTLSLETRKGTHIPNAQFMEISALRRKNIDGLAFQAMEQLGRPKPERCRRPATATYNCHGMTFANRRTGVQETSAVNLILAEDGYIEVPKLKDVLPGDVAVYYDGSEISHSGIVMFADGSSGIMQILLLSKWGHGGEYLHRPEACPYDPKTIRYFREAQDGTGPIQPD